jgi:hypothetical protein
MRLASGQNEEDLMSDVTPVARKSALHTVAVVLSSLVIGLPLLVGRLVEAILDNLNLNNVDVTQGLAYLREILVSSFTSLGILLVLIVVVLVMLYRRAKSFDAIKLPVVALVVQIVVGVIALLSAGLADAGA